MNAQFGHNETAVRLGILAMVESREAVARAWLDFGRSMTEARKLLPPAEFNSWFSANNFKHGGRTVTPIIRDASMLATKNPEEFIRAFKSGSASTLQAAVKLVSRSGRSDPRDFVYVMANPLMPGIVKIGMTKIDPVARAKQLSQNSGIPSPFAVASSFRTMKAREVEKRAHAHLIGARVSDNREFFKVSEDEAFALISGIISEVEA